VFFSLRQQNYSRCLTYQIWSGSNQIWKVASHMDHMKWHTATHS